MEYGEGFEKGEREAMGAAASLLNEQRRKWEMRVRAGPRGCLFNDITPSTKALYLHSRRRPERR